VAESLGHTICRSTVANILKEAGIEPAPERRKGMSWAEFLKIHWDALASCDFVNVEVVTMRGYVRFQVFFVMQIATREVEIAGISSSIGGSWMKQMARNLTDSESGFLREMKYLIHDRDPLFTSVFRDLLAGSGVKCMRLPSKSPNLNAHAERFVRTARETLSLHIFFGEKHLRHVLSETMKHYHEERHHQGLGGKLIRPAVANDNGSVCDGEIECRERLGGLLEYYSRRAAQAPRRLGRVESPEQSVQNALAPATLVRCCCALAQPQLAIGSTARTRVEGAARDRSLEADAGFLDRTRVDLFDTMASFEAFGKTLVPILASLEIDVGQPQITEVHNIIRG
jgi:hypothetical protein